MKLNVNTKVWQTYIILLAFASCTLQKPVKPEAPANLLPAQKMTEVRTQIHLADALVSSMHQANDSALIQRKSMYALIYQRAGVSENDFVASFNYYKLMPEQIDSIYAHVIEELGKLESQKSRAR
ncbi:MAG: DUF4296 domain-containing protein [Bacteroidota bacterium]